MLRPLLIAIGLLATAIVPGHADDAKWPEPDADSRPWLRWWWPSDLDCPEDPTAELEEIDGQGFGGVEVLPLGADRDLLWPGPGWAARASETAKAAETLELGFDLAAQAGPVPLAFGDEDAGRQWFPFSMSIDSSRVDTELPEGLLHCLAAWPPQGPPVDLLDAIDPESNKLVWDAPPGAWQIFGLFDEPASPALDPFSPAAIKDSLLSFDLALADYDAPFPRSRPLQRTAPEFSDWTLSLFDQFLAARGYDLREQLPALLGAGAAGVVERVRCDYRETLSDLYRMSLEQWQEHTRNQGSLSRSLLRAQPGHPLELHGVADFPGVLGSTEDDTELHFAASAAHLTMKPMVVATLTPARPATPDSIKRSLDELWLDGANHVILDGRTSALDPARRTLPLDDASGLWTNLAPFSDYVTRCQSILQLGAPDPDLLLYYPAHDFWTDRGGIPPDPDERRAWLRPTGYQRAYDGLTERGILFDSVSDRLLRHAEVINDGVILIGGLTYRGILLPEVRRLPEQTATKLLDLARRGARIGSLGRLPEDVPGFPNPDIRRGTLIQALQQLPVSSTLESDDFDELIQHLDITPEPMHREGLRFIRRSHPDGHHYFIVNQGPQTVETLVPLARPATSVVKLDPRQPGHSGLATLIDAESGPKIPLRLEPGESIILRTFRDKEAEARPWSGAIPDAPRRILGGKWTVHFPSQGPMETTLLGSWRTWPGQPPADQSAVVRYELEFDATPGRDAALDLGKVAHTARVTLNGNDLGTSFAPPHRFPLGNSLKSEDNRLEVTVTSLSDPTLPAGLLGPVELIAKPPKQDD